MASQRPAAEIIRTANHAGAARQIRYDALEEHLPELRSDLSAQRNASAALEARSAPTLESRLPTAQQLNLNAPVPADAPANGAEIFANSWKSLQSGGPMVVPRAILPGRSAAAAQNGARVMGKSKRVQFEDEEESPIQQGEKKWKHPERDDQGVQEIVRKDREATERKKANELRVMLLRMSRDPELKADLEETGMNEDLKPAALRKLDYAGLVSLKEQVDLALQTSLDVTPYMTGLQLGARALESISWYSFETMGTVPLTGLEDAVSQDPTIRKTVKKLAYEQMSYAWASPGWTLAMQLPSAAMKVYTQNKQVLPKLGDQYTIPQQVLDKYADL